MRIHEILLEVVQFQALMNKVTHAIPDTLEDFIQKYISHWSHDLTAERRKKAGYHPWENDPKVSEYKKFDPQAFEEFNRNWNVYSDGIGDKLNELVPYDIEKQNNHIAYHAMGRVSDVLTKLVQEYVRSKYGDPVKLDHGKLERPVDKIRVVVWWQGKTDDYVGVYRRRSYNVAGEETKLEIIVSRKKWAEWLREQIVNELSGEGVNFREFSKNIISTFIHEYAHFEQDAKGSRGDLSLIPTAPTKITAGGRAKTTRRASYWDDTTNKSNLIRYYGKTEEIDANANGAAATIVDHISRDFRRYRGRRDDWTVDMVPKDDWNAAIKEYLDMGDYGIPDKERSRYIDQINGYLLRLEQLKKMSPEERQRELSPEELSELTLKAKFLTKVKQRFLKTYILRLQGYLR